MLTCTLQPFSTGGRFHILVSVACISFFGHLIIPVEHLMSVRGHVLMAEISFLLLSCLLKTDLTFWKYCVWLCLTFWHCYSGSHSAVWHWGPCCCPVCGLMLFNLFSPDHLPFLCHHPGYLYVLYGCGSLCLQFCIEAWPLKNIPFVCFETLGLLL